MDYRGWRPLNGRPELLVWLFACKAASRCVHAFFTAYRLHVRSVWRSALLQLQLPLVTLCGCYAFTFTDLQVSLLQIEVATGNFPYKDWKNLFEQIRQVVEEAPPLLPAGQFSKQLEDFVASWSVTDIYNNSNDLHIHFSPWPCLLLNWVLFAANVCHLLRPSCFRPNYFQLSNYYRQGYRFPGISGNLEMSRNLAESGKRPEVGESQRICAVGEIWLWAAQQNNFPVPYSCCNSFFVRDVHGEYGLTNVHLFNILPAISFRKGVGKSGTFFLSGQR